MGIFEMITVIVIITTGGNVLTSWIKHRSNVAEMKLQGRNSQPAVNNSAEIDALRQEIRQLRDTTMQYDLSFDTALQRLEHRIEGLERRSVSSSNATSTSEIRIGQQ